MILSSPCLNHFDQAMPADTGAAGVHIWHGPMHALISKVLKLSSIYVSQAISTSNLLVKTYWGEGGGGGCGPFTVLLILGR